MKSEQGKMQNGVRARSPRRFVGALWLGWDQGESWELYRTGGAAIFVLRYECSGRGTTYVVTLRP